MRSKLIHILFISIFSSTLALGQVVTGDVSKELGRLYSKLVNNYNDNDRLRINDSIELLIDKYVISDTVFSHRFTNLRYLGQITSPDSLLKIITWNLVLQNGKGKYFCYIVKRNESEDVNRVYRLRGDYRADPIRVDTTYSLPDWYGALYYDVRPYVVDDEQCWVLLGIDYGNPFISRKIIDVLSFKSDGSIVFGKLWFDTGDKICFRTVFEYASNGMMSLRFVSSESIVFDHLVPLSPSQEGDRQYYGPDYSNDAYNLENGLWKLKINVDVRNKE